MSEGRDVGGPKVSVFFAEDDLGDGMARPSSGTCQVPIEELLLGVFNQARADVV